MAHGNIIAIEEAAMAKVPILAEQINTRRIVLNVASVGLSSEQFFRLCGDNSDLRLELTAQKEIIVMSPTRFKTGGQNAESTYQLVGWAKRDGRGAAFDSNTGFTLPNGAVRSPDASWIPRSRWESLPAEDLEVFAHICPDFVIELWSPSDTLKEIQFKLMEYIANGARLGFLIYPPKRRVYVYRPNQPVQCLDQPASVSGDPELPGFTLDLTEIWK